MSRFAFPLVVLIACTSETTSFRTTERGDGIDREGPAAAAYDVRLDRGIVANVHVWSSGGYISNTGLPMTHVGFEIANKHTTAIAFDGEQLQLAAFDKGGGALPVNELAVVTPLGPQLVVIAPGATQRLDVYFELRVRPRAVESMRARWGLRIGDVRHTGSTQFVRDDAMSELDRTPALEPQM